jgi:comEA protein
LKKINQEKFEKIKLVGIIIFCIAVGSGSVKSYFDDNFFKKDIVYEYQEELHETNDIGNATTIAPDITTEFVEDNKKENIMVNINLADSQKLQTLSGIGPSKAGSIIKYRDDYGGFTAIEEITQVKGIGDATFLKIKDLITIR